MISNAHKSIFVLKQ